MLKRNRFFVETSDPDVFETLRKDAVISAARVSDEGVTCTSVSVDTLSFETPAMEACLVVDRL